MDIYQRQLLILLPILNLLCGITIDLYAPSLSDIRHFYNTTESIAQYSITVTVLGFAIGQFVFGYLSDYYGRKITVIGALVVYLLVSLVIIFSSYVEVLLACRLVQGITIGSFAINSRAVAVDNFTGIDLRVAIIYLSIAWGIGPIIAPYLGGILTTYFDWKVTIVALCTYALIVLVFISLVIKQDKVSTFDNKQYVFATFTMLSDKEFLLRTFILGICYAQGIVFNLVAPFWVSDIFNKSPAVFGQYALLVGVGYFTGTLINRILITKFSEMKLIRFGLFIGTLSSLVFIFSDSIFTINMFVISSIVLVINFGAGFIFSNVMASNIAKYAKYAGTCTALQGSLMLVVGTIILGVISAFSHPSIFAISCIYFSMNIVLVGVYVCIMNFIHLRLKTK